MKNFFKYLKVDLYRCFLSIRFVSAVVISISILLVASLEANAGFFNPDVYSLFLYTMYTLPHILIMSGAAFAYAGSICEDMEHLYIRNEIMRGTKKSFVAARILTIFLSAQSVVTIGCTLFAVILRIWYPWVIEKDGNMYEITIESGLFGELPAGGFHLPYFVLWGVVYGILAGVLALIASWLSLYIPNKTLMLISPVVIFYFLEQLSVKIFPQYVGLEIFFTIDFCWTQNTGMAMLVVISVAVLGMLLFGCLIYNKLKKGGVVCG